ncbi:dihydroorotase [Pantoea sp. Mhis]|uniref:dihydroorotase n=1 Tax=Pantoea sp. Mhis TaxID=2576759 RepID=UPI001359A58C|nr:dihydroorotase [Pantoea sp. Mhis]MXP56301.1 dihydroorotase [Pantoea sp. Mhis]
MSIEPQRIIIRCPDDWHVHLRDGSLLRKVLPYTSSINSRAMVMPNLSSPITNINAAIAYRDRILSVLPINHVFTPLMTCYLTDTLNPNEIESGYHNNIFTAAKLYPANVTTNSNNGVTNINLIFNILERMQKIGMPILIHSEVTDSYVDIFDREARFIDTVLEPLRRQFSELKIVMEHISTKEAAEYITSGNEFLGATITPHHLMFNRNDMLVNGLHPHLYCSPVLKSNIHQKALHKLIASGNNRIFLGTDTAPHPRHLKETSCGQPGIFSAPISLLAYITVFNELNALQHFEKFCSENGPNFYGLPLNQGTLTIVRRSYQVKNTLANNTLVPFLAGKILEWCFDT